MRHTSTYLKSLCCGLIAFGSSLTSQAEEMAMEEMQMDMMMDAMPTNKAELFEAAKSVLRRSCYECHGATKQKGDYRMDNKVSIYLAGDSEVAPIVSGKPLESELFARITLPVEDDDVMPPKKKARLSVDDIRAIKDWIASGAEWIDSDVQGLPTTYVEIGDEATNELIEKINETEAKAEYNAWGDNSVRVDLGVVNKEKIKDALNALEDFGDRLAWLDCSHLELKASFYEDLPQYSKLQRLHLDYSNVSDEDLESLSKLPMLSYLNLYSTDISDEGIASLSTCKSLTKVFLSETKVTKDGVAQLKAANPDITIVYK